MRRALVAAVIFSLFGAGRLCLAASFDIVYTADVRGTLGVCG